MKPITILLRLKDEKKHSVRYDAALKEDPVTAVYINKLALTVPYPQTLVLTIAADTSAERK